MDAEEPDVKETRELLWNGFIFTMFFAWEPYRFSGYSASWNGQMRELAEARYRQDAKS